MKRVLPVLLTGFQLVACSWNVLAQEAPPRRGPRDVAAGPVTAAIIDKIKEEGEKRSQVMATLSYMTDVIGPRLTNSPGLKRANEWTRDTMLKWGLENGRLEPWGPFGRGWSLVRFSAQVVEPQCIPLIAYPKAWTPGLESPTVADVVLLEVKNEADLEKYKGKLEGKIVLISEPREVQARFEPPGKRYTDSELLALANAGAPGERTFPRPPTPPTTPTPPASTTSAAANGAATPTTPPPPRRGGFDPAQFRLARLKAEFLAREKPLLTIDTSSRGDGGTIFVQSVSTGGSFQSRGPRPWSKDAPKTAPQITLAVEHYNRLARMLRQGEAIKMAVELVTRFHDDDEMGYNTVVEIPGGDKKDEIVMLGGHLDSWHSATGATDNAAGCAVAMEAVRILKALDLKPRRTVRVALWTGEEQGLLGSRAYVKEHFGSLEADPLDEVVAQLVGGTPRRTLKRGPEYDKLSVYFNLDNGTGKIRGIHMEGNEAVRPIFRRWFDPFRDMGAATLTSSRTGGTDHMSFDQIGLPGFQFIQDSIEYETRTHHSNQDVYDRIQADDMRQASIIMATLVYQAAMADEKLPRKPLPGS